MMGSANPETLLSITRKFQAGDVEEADDLFAANPPILRHEQHPIVGLAIQLPTDGADPRRMKRCLRRSADPKRGRPVSS